MKIREGGPATILQDTSSPAIVAALDANLQAFFAACGDTPEGEVHDEPDVLWFCSGLPCVLFNAVARTHLSGENVTARVAQTMAAMTARRLPLWWCVGPSTQPADLPRHLEAHGVRHSSSLAGMAVDLRALPRAVPAPAGLTITPVDDEQSLRHWTACALTAAGFPDDLVLPALPLFRGLALSPTPRVRCYLASLDGVPVATALLSLAACVAGIYLVGTLPAARRRGIGGAITLAPLHEARGWGYRLGVLQASSQGYPVYRRLGFQDYCTFQIYTWSPPRTSP